MIENLEEIRNYGTWFFLWPRKSWWEGYDRKRWICDLCGKEKVFNVRCYNYNGWDGTFYSDYPDCLIIEYGKYNKRNLSICKTHSDKEIEKKLEDLK